MSCSIPMLLDARRSLTARNSTHVPIAFWMRAPESGPLRVEFRWSSTEHATVAARALGAALEDEEGRLIGEAVWNVPPGWRSGTDEPYTVQTLWFDLADRDRGRPVRLFVKDAKWIEWRIVGLDIPWLSDRKDGVP